MLHNTFFDDLNKMEEKALTFIKKHEPPEGYFVGFSGGKDSTVVYDLVKRSKVKYQVYYSMTLIDPPEVVQFIRKNYPEVTILKPKTTFWKNCLKEGMPLINKRWCCKLLKENPTYHILLKHRIMGIRAEESYKRRQRGEIHKFQSRFFYKPIFWWSSKDIWDYIHKYNLPYCPLYDEGFTRLGCIVCPFLSPKNIEKHRKRWPGMYRILDKTLKENYNNYISKSKNSYKMDLETYLKWPNWPIIKKNKKDLFSKNEVNK